MYLCYKYLLYFDFLEEKEEVRKINIHTILQKSAAEDYLFIFLFIKVF